MITYSNFKFNKTVFPLGFFLGGGHWGVLETAKPKKKSSKTAKPPKNSAKTENRIQTTLDNKTKLEPLRGTYRRPVGHEIA